MGVTVSFSSIMGDILVGYIFYEVVAKLHVRHFASGGVTILVGGQRIFSM